ncbi:hypothetical protein WA1_08680 [Scytonema hofmannii PCC 7110]|uniref:Uncharacterized protein n=1 Tax=Scytonema hofmannii PCC 7110 TaxID=128403 RepID=A0A139WS25_9CYAN|nr:hypothetical protein [Scytonema hofmannii]KYC35223.1 hypothetical protein WA1_08680 [Scytonema hofmannii PCC 7110]
MIFLKNYVPLVMFAFSFFTALFLLGVLVNNSLTNEVQIIDGLLLSVMSCLSFVVGKWLGSKIETGNSLLENPMDESLAQSVLNLWIITGVAALYISFNGHRNLEDFVLLEVVVFSLVLWKTSANQLKVTVTDLKGVKSELETIQSTLKVTQTELKTTETELKTTESKLKMTETELKATESKLKTTETELKTTESKLKMIETELKATESKLKVTETELKTTESKLKMTENELNASQERLTKFNYSV